jgi:hypothetical protein
MQVVLTAVVVAITWAALAMVAGALLAALCWIEDRSAE